MNAHIRQLDSQACGAALLAGSCACAWPALRRLPTRWSRPAAKDGEFIIGFSQANNAEPYRQHVNDELTAAAKAVPQFTLQIADGAGNVNTQTSQVDNFITQKVDLLLISPFEAAPLTPAVKRAMDAGIPVIELDRKTVGDPGKDYTAFIGGDNYKIADGSGRIHRQDAAAGRRRGRGAAGPAELDPGGRAAERLQGRREGERQDPGRRRAGRRLAAGQSADRLRRDAAGASRTSRWSMPATT